VPRRRLADRRQGAWFQVLTAFRVLRSS
jgi:hypothetical protein